MLNCVGVLKLNASRRDLCSILFCLRWMLGMNFDEVRYVCRYCRWLSSVCVVNSVFGGLKW